ncbi:hypothetical protein Acsp03_14000 [Actinomadura sp. NBRC 104412]|uniref:DUF5941 domain-containing protein n=1 Tax=Actinomadura sp. NBRC 104412 TaxID=3032203 RepID=UPI00249FFD3F|nr:DUF5941 domain-containing protein [Actinomadura sp. NBRC 104412]GLZ03934.1 hypothetical protein Acsp03_14000 [Actinomadura sp. NBRC 104412]
MTTPGRLPAYRDDGAISLMLGRLAGGYVAPLHGFAVAMAVAGVLLAARVGEQRTLALFAPVVALLLTGPSAGHLHDGRIDWLVPPGIRAIEYGYLAALGFAQDVAAPLVFVLIAVLAYHHHDIVYRSRQGHRPSARFPVLRPGLGWDGRMLLVAFAGLSDLLPFAYATLAVYLGVTLVRGGVLPRVPSAEGVRVGTRGGVTLDLEEEEA